MRGVSWRLIAWAFAFLGGIIGLVPGASAQQPALVVTTAVEPSYQGLWWNAPANSEPYWGLNFAHQGDQVFGTWYTYDTTGRPWWLSTLATRASPASNVYSGPIYVDTGPPFNNFVGSGKPTQVGTATLTFSDADNGTFAYTVNATSQLKSITRFDLGTGPQPTCTYSTTVPDYAAATNYQDLWWVADGSESGWGVNFAHQGDSVFATWYTYDVDGAPLWLSVLAPRVGTSNVYAGTLYRTSGSRFDAYDPAKAVVAVVGTATLTFKDGGSATFSYTTYGGSGLPAVTQTKTLARYVFWAPAGTVCSSPVRVPTSVTIQSPTPSPWVGETVRLTATVRDQFGYVIEGMTPTWSSSNPLVAIISASGDVQGLAAGPVVVLATINGVQATQALTIAPMPQISVTVGTTKEVVFRWATDRCNDQDTPDLPTHVVRAEDGSLVLFAGNAPRFYVSRGPDFASLTRDCTRPVLESADHRTPESYENWEWIAAVYRDGNRWHALISNEFHDSIAGTCDPGNPAPDNPCWYNSVTYAISTDGAHTFSKPMAPAHVVAPPPNVWQPPLPGELPNMGWQFFEGFVGLHSLVRGNDGFVYGIVSVVPNKSETATYHPCLVRTNSLGDPASWRAWDGAGFGLRMVSPYVLGSPAPICQRLDIPGFLITFNTYLDRFLYLGNFSGTMGGKSACGFYYSLSPDLFHWSPLQLVAAMRDDSVCPFEPQQPGLLEPVPVLYPTVIDHTDTTINFERPGRTPYLYYVRYNRGTPNDPLYWLDRDLVRVPLTFTRID